jgi:flagellar basal body-associated protein FliL
VIRRAEISLSDLLWYEKGVQREQKKEGEDIYLVLLGSLSSFLLWAGYAACFPFCLHHSAKNKKTKETHQRKPVFALHP